MSTLLLWSLLSYVTGSPLLSLAIVLGFLWYGTSYAFFAFSPLRWWQRFQRSQTLERTLAVNPHDRAASFELAELYVGWRRYARAVAVLKPNLAQDQDDDTWFVAGVAAFGAGDAPTGQRLLGAVAERNPKFRQGAAFLELGRWWLKVARAKDAVAVLEHYVAICTSTIEGRTLLAKAYSATGDTAAATKAANEAWAHFREAPGFQRRRERIWAYRAKPERAFIAFAVVLLVLAGLGWLILR